MLANQARFVFGMGVIVLIAGGCMPTVKMVSQKRDTQRPEPSRRAQATLDDVINRIHRMPPPEYVSVQTDAVANGETVWIQDVRYDEGFFVGTVATTATHRRKPVEVKVHREDVTDWLVIENQQTSGGYSLPNKD
ncbi:MAG: DUF2314 domain-containing protein [Fimbriimonadaceae bacterium]|nr:DUF2314 domain-containing protein [Fimbriimonadaceae bacterium]